jgi:hypothetical protein
MPAVFENDGSLLQPDDLMALNCCLTMTTVLHGINLPTRRQTMALPFQTE